MSQVEGVPEAKNGEWFAVRLVLLKTTVRFDVDGVTITALEVGGRAGDPSSLSVLDPGWAGVLTLDSHLFDRYTYEMLWRFMEFHGLRSQDATAEEWTIGDRRMRPVSRETTVVE